MMDARTVESIAVVIPARDPGPFLDETLRSLVDQTRRPTEIVVVDDGSRDDSVAEAVARFPGVGLIRQEPSGRGHARNQGAAATSAPYLLFLDADDLLRPDSLALMSAVLDAQSGVDMVVGGPSNSPTPCTRRSTERERPNRWSGLAFSEPP